MQDNSEMIEKAIEKRLRQEVAKIGGKAYKLVSTGNAGMPDRLVCLPGGKAVFVELKRPKGGKVRLLQKYRMSELRIRGFEVRVINTEEQIDEFVNEFNPIGTRK